MNLRSRIEVWWHRRWIRRHPHNGTMMRAAERTYRNALVWAIENQQPWEVYKVRNER